MARLTVDPAVPHAALAEFSTLAARIGSPAEEVAAFDRQLGRRRGRMTSRVG